MTLDHLPALDVFSAPYDHDFVFKAHNPDKKHSSPATAARSAGRRSAAI